MFEEQDVLHRLRTHNADSPDPGNEFVMPSDLGRSLLTDELGLPESVRESLILRDADSMPNAPCLYLLPGSKYKGAGYYRVDAKLAAALADTDVNALALDNRRKAIEAMEIMGFSLDSEQLSTMKVMTVSEAAEAIRKSKDA